MEAQAGTAAKEQSESKSQAAAQADAKTADKDKAVAKKSQAEEEVEKKKKVQEGEALALKSAELLGLEEAIAFLQRQRWTHAAAIRKTSVVHRDLPVPADLTDFADRMRWYPTGDLTYKLPDDAYSVSEVIGSGNSGASVRQYVAQGGALCLQSRYEKLYIFVEDMSTSTRSRVIFWQDAAWPFDRTQAADVRSLKDKQVIQVAGSNTQYQCFLFSSRFDPEYFSHSWMLVATRVGK